MKKLIYITVVLIAILRCNTKDQTQNITYLNPALKNIVEAYIESELKWSNKTIMTVMLRKNQDTTEFYLWDSFSFTLPEKFMGYTQLDRYKICFVADSVYSDYFRTDRKIDIPDDFIEVAKQKIGVFEEPAVFWSVNPTAIYCINCNKK